MHIHCVLTAMHTPIFLSLGIHKKFNIRRKNNAFRTKNDMLKMQRSVDFFFMSSYLQGEVWSTLRETSTFSKSHGLAFEISLEDDISIIAATLREHISKTLATLDQIHALSIRKVLNIS